MITFTSREVQAYRDDPDAERTATCPVCVPGTPIAVGLCTPRVCACGNVWQPWQPVGSRAVSVVVEDHAVRGAPTHRRRGLVSILDRVEAGVAGLFERLH